VPDPVYLVSRCASIDEFVAAFRRYVDRVGVFVPSAQPVAVGKRARFALTLRDGGVMIEGDGEVITASTRASGLHGRPGMTLRFSNLDEPSKVVIAHLEKVRFGAKVTAPSDHLQPRPGPTPPDEAVNAVPYGAAGNDPAQALAECVVVGDGVQLMQPGAPSAAIGKLEARGTGTDLVSASSTKTGFGSGPVPAPAVPPPVPSRPMPAPPISQPMPAMSPPPPTPPPVPPSGKFAIPSIPPAQPSDPARPKTPTNPRQTMLGQAFGPSPAPSRELPAVMPPAPSAPVSVSAAPDAIPTHTPSTAVTIAAGAATAPMQRPPIADAVPSPQSDAAWLITTTRGVAPPGVSDPPEVEVEPPKPPMIPKAAKRTMMGIAAISREPARPTDPNMGAPVYELGHVDDEVERKPSGMESNTIEVDPTLMGPPPEPPSIDDLPSPLQVASSPMITTPMPQLEAQAAALRPYVSSGAPADGGPNALPGLGAGVPPVPRPKTNPSLAETEPNLVPIQTPMPGSMMSTGPMPPLVPQPMTQVTAPPPGAMVGGPLPGMPGVPMMPGPVPGSYVAPAPGLPAIPGGDGRTPGYASPLEGQRALTDGGSGFFLADSDASGMTYRTDDLTAMVQAPRQKRILVIAISCAVVVALGIVAIAMLAGGDDTAEKKRPAAGSGSGTAAAKTPDGSGSGSTVVAVGPGSGSGSATIDEEDDVGSGSGAGSSAGSGSGAGSGSAPVVVTKPPDKPADGGCKARITSTPSGADVVIAGKVRGKTPVEVGSLKCAPTQVQLRRPRYENLTKTIRPTAKGAKVNLKLQRPQFTIKVSSAPSGATISVGSRKVGKTPTAIKVNGYEPVSITVSKEGYSSTTEKVTVKQNGTAIKLTLKK
jgi:hypothetical protein